MNTVKAKIMRWSLSMVLGVIGIAMILPILWMVSSAFKYESDVFKIPMQWIPDYVNLNNFKTAVTDFPYFTWYFNTFKTTIIVVLVTLLFSSMSGYAFAKLKFKGKDFIFFLFIATLMIPVQVRVIPQFMMFKSWDMINKHWTITLPWIYNGFSIFLMRQFFTSIPNELIEAAKIDGSNDYWTFFKVVLPLAKPSLSALGILSFTWGWNAYFGPLIYISDTTKQVLAVGIASFKAEYSNNFSVQMAGSTLALIPIIIVYLIAQKQFIEGIALSGVKG
ncbi:carbohydrate ABC transporter permease [Vallitalea pronyensis]|uniref:Carbohydrate ABC transporter permease n=1 Tax=Vallitalea pronyensis TaxID=1348613 RepID=A0A8J8SFZ3_9FIRM|nr:carbohydrate ABC transporter permease [Vallitalea pronyensis]QUI22210.1 carbohydrate ABC transporter permease [Vallitalea pronyensis]